MADIFSQQFRFTSRWTISPETSCFRVIREVWFQRQTTTLDGHVEESVFEISCFCNHPSIIYFRLMPISLDDSDISFDSQVSINWPFPVSSLLLRSYTIQQGTRAESDSSTDRPPYCCILQILQCPGAPSLPHNHLQTWLLPYCPKRQSHTNPEIDTSQWDGF